MYALSYGEGNGKIGRELVELSGYKRKIVANMANLTTFDLI